MIGQLSRHMEQNWRALGLPRPVGPSEQRWLVMNGGLGVQSKLVCLVWADGGLQPDYVVKFARYPTYNGGLEAEYNAMQSIQLYSPRGPAPAPLLAFYLNDLLVTVQRAIPGRPLRLYLREHPGRHLGTLRGLDSLVRWLTSVHALSARPTTREDIAPLVFEPLDTAAEEHGDFSPQEIRGLERLHALAEEMAAHHTLPFVFNHNDLSATNLMVDGQGRLTGIIDWEHAAEGLPLLDLFYFLSAYGHETREAAGDRVACGSLRGFRELFFLPESREAGSLPISFSERWIGAYCRRLGIDLGWLPLMFGLTWLLHAGHEREHGLSGQWTPTGLPTAPVQAPFRSRLRYFLENWDASLVARLAGGSQV